MTHAELLTALGRAGVTVSRAPDGRPVLDGILSERTIQQARHHRWLFTWGLEGVRTGHRWHACDECGEIQLLDRERRCRMTPRCGGTMRTVAAPEFRLMVSAGSEAG